MSEKLVLENLTKIFGNRPDAALALLDEGLDKDAVLARTGQAVGVVGASLSVAKGEVFVLMGLSGSGKSTLVRLLNRLIEPTEGRVLIDGVDVTAMSQQDLIQLRRRDMSMVFQSFALMPHLSVLDNVAFGLAVAGVPADERRERATAALDKVGLRQNADNRPDELSGGMQQRVGLARALATEPSIMLMDEAFSALDPLIRAEMQDELLRLLQDRERTIVFVSHDLDEAIRIGDRIAVMAGGRIVQVGTPQEILRDPADDYVASFFRGVRASKVLTAGDVARREQIPVIDPPDIAAAARLLDERDREYGVLLDASRRFRGVVSVDSLQRALGEADPALGKAMIEGIEPLPADLVVAETVEAVAASPCPLPVVDGEGRYRGAISKTLLLETLGREG